MKNYMCFCFLLIFAGCANVLAPSGGPKDTFPPKLINASPKNSSINFREKKIVLFFDEYIKLENLENIQLSPTCYPKPLISVIGKQIEVELLCELDSNTTYTLNFGKSIKDINEGNTLMGFQYFFSTGNNLDTLSISGTVSELYFNKAVPEAMIALATIEDSLRPYYYTFSDELGGFLFENIKRDEYFIFSILDENNNLLLDTNELASIPRKITNFNKPHNLGLFAPSYPKTEMVVSSHFKNAITFQHNIVGFEEKISVLGVEGIWNHLENKSVFWFKKDLPKIYYNYENRTDSITINNLGKTPPINLFIKEPQHEFIKNNTIRFQSDVPIKSIDNNKISGGLDTKLINTDIIDPFHFEIPIEKGEELTLIVNKGAIQTNIESYNDSIAFNINLNPEKYGSIIINSPNQEANLTIELFRGDQIVRKTKLSKSNLIDWVAPGSYNLRIFLDENNNNRWDAGNINTKTPSEKIKIYPTPIKVRKNWELEITIPKM